MMSQANWSDARKAALWQQIIQQKILNQAGVIQEVSVEAARQIAAFAETVTPGDATNREDTQRRSISTAFSARIFRAI